MSLISISNLTFAYEGSYDNIFKDVSFRIDTDWKLGFVGRNGRGKTTFLNLLLGKYEYRGSISACVGFDYFPYDVENRHAAAIDVIESILPGFQHWALERELSLLEVGSEALGRPFDTLSNGEQTKVLLAALFMKQNRFLLIDEPTNHLDMRGREILCKYLNGKNGFILVSHDRALLDGCTDHTLSINRTNIEIQKGNFSSWLLSRERQDSFELAENEKLKKDISRLSAASKRTSDWSDRVEQTKYHTTNSGVSPDRGYIGHKAEKMMQRSKAIAARRERAITEKSALLQNLENAEELKITQPPFYTSRFASLEHVSILYGGKAACRDVSFTIERGDLIALRGKNGSGKSSLLRLICGEELTYTGNFQRAGRLLISYVPQDTSFLSGILSDYAAQSGIDESLFKAILRKLDFSRVQFEKDMRGFSGGQKKKVLIARSLCEKAQLLVWDEPLNFVDVISRMQIENLLLQFRPTIIFTEHDRVFCDKIATKTVSLD